MSPNLATDSAPPGALLTEDSAAQALVGRYARVLRYCHDSRSWHIWDGVCWRKDGTRRVLHLIRELVRDLTNDGRACIRSGKLSFARGTESYAQADPCFAMRAKEWDCDPFLLGTPGGVVDLRNGELRSAISTDYITRIAGATPAIAPICPRWLDFLHEACGGDPKIVGYLQRVFGYCLTGSIKEHALFFVHGPGGNGKSVLVNTLARCLGAYFVAAPMETFTASTFDKHPTELAMLAGARLVTASETEEGRAWADSRIKTLTGGDPISARFMRQDYFTYHPRFKLVVVGNYKPALKNVDAAVRRRFNIIPFEHCPIAPDRDLEDKLAAELPGILRWAIEGCLEWQRIGLAAPPTIVEETQAYLSDQDCCSQWLDERSELDPGNQNLAETSAKLFADWREFAVAAGEDPGSQRRLAERLKRRGAEPVKGPNEVRMFRGIRLKGAVDVPR